MDVSNISKANIATNGYQPEVAFFESPNSCIDNLMMCPASFLQNGEELGVNSP